MLFYGHSSGNKIQMKLNKRQVEGRTIPGPGAPQDCSVPSDTLSVYFREIYVNTRMVTNKSDQQDKRPLYDRNFSCSSIYLPSQLSLSLFSNRLLGDGRSKTRISFCRHLMFRNLIIMHRERWLSAGRNYVRTYAPINK